MSPRRSASRARPASMFPPASSAAPGVKDPDEDPRLHSRRARRRSGIQARLSVSGRDNLSSNSMTVQQPNSFRTGPDERGHFGIYGGRFVAETLMPNILELEAAYTAAKADPAYQKEMDHHLAHFVGRPSPLYFAERLTRKIRRRQNLFQARGSQPHRRAQGEQRHRPDHAGLAHGQEAHHRRDRRRHAWRRHRHALRQVRPALRRLYGRGRCRAAAAERAAHEDARRRSAPGRRPARTRSRTR